MTMLQSDVTSDWISSNTTFYNLKTNRASKNILDVINFQDFQWDSDGLEAFCDFGYAVFGKTPIKDVHFLLPAQVLRLENGFLKVFETTEDDKLFEKTFDPSTSEKSFDLLAAKLSQYGNNVDEVVIPLSGGLDSRLLLYFFPEPSKIKAYTYGVSQPQSDSFEVRIAEKLAQFFNVSWKQMTLGQYNKYVDDFYGVFGPSSHCHGMYHWEFYDLIRKDGNRSAHLLSGLIGDAWAGSVKVSPIASPDELINLALHHQMKADSSFLKQRNSKNGLYEFFWERENSRLDNPRWRILLSMRTKMMLLKYLITLPEKHAYSVYAPFIDQDLALSMLTLKDSERENRSWQRKFLADKKLLDVLDSPPNMSNNLNTQALKLHPVEPLDPSLLREIFDESYITWINSNLLSSPMAKVKESLHSQVSGHRLKNLLNRLKLSDQHLKAYFAYLTLYPLQQVIKARNKAINS
jgi:asparagine synthetase B (glutamine-hydrolysing)